MPGSHGLWRNWCATGTVRVAASISKCPDSTTRTVPGCFSFTRPRSVAPSIPGIRMSVTITSNGICCNCSRASAPPTAKTISHLWRYRTSRSSNPSSTRRSSSTNRIRFFIGFNSVGGAGFYCRRKVDRERGPLAHLARERQTASVLAHDDGPGDGKPLPRSPSHRLGCKKRVEHPVANFLPYARSRILDLDHHYLLCERRAHADQPLAVAPLDHVANGV